MSDSAFEEKGKKREINSSFSISEAKSKIEKWKRNVEGTFFWSAGNFSCSFGAIFTTKYKAANFVRTFYCMHIHEIKHDVVSTYVITN